MAWVMVAVALATAAVAAPHPAAAFFDALGYVDAVTKPGWLLAVDLGGRAQVGNVEELRGDAGAVTAWRRGASLLFFMANGEYGRASGVDYATRMLEHLRYRYYLSDLWAYELFAQHEFNRFTRVQLRLLAGFGPRLGIPIGTHGEFALAVGAMYEHEELDANPVLADSVAIDDAIRLASYAKLAHAGEAALVSWTTYVQPKFNAPEDWRLNSRFDLELPIRQWLSWTWSAGYTYDSRPPLTIERHDFDTAVALRFRWLR